MPSSRMAVFSHKFNDLLTRIQEGSPDLDMEPLAEIMFHNIGEDVTEDNIRQIVDSVLRSIVNKFPEFKNFKELLTAYSGYFIWNLPKVEPENWSQVTEYFKALEKVYSAA